MQKSKATKYKYHKCYEVERFAKELKSLCLKYDFVLNVAQFRVGADSVYTVWDHMGYEETILLD